MATTKSRDSVSSKSESMDGNHVTFSFFTDQSSSCLPGKLHALTSCGSLHGGSSPLQPAIMGEICHGSQQLNMQPRCKSKIPISPMTSFQSFKAMISGHQQHLCCPKCETLLCPPQQLSTRINFTRSTWDTRL